MTAIATFNAMVRKWASRQPTKYRRTALAFGYRCDRQTHSFGGTLQWISKQSRKRPGEGVSESTLGRHLKDFEANGVITVERRRSGSRNESSVYHVDFDKVIEVGDMGRRQRRRNRVEDAEHAAFLESTDVEPPEDDDAKAAVEAEWDAWDADIKKLQSPDLHVDPLE
jgi:hypothetical protein